MSSRLGIDVGGTFTDLLLFDDESGDMQLLKTPSTPDDPSVGIKRGIERLVAESGIKSGDIRSLLHGTTVPANIVLQEKGARVGLLVTRNFEQVLHLARSRTPGPLAGWTAMEKPDPLADLEVTRGIPERINARGEVLSPIDEQATREAVKELADAGVESITVSLLHSYANPVHERRVREIVAEIAPDMPVSISSDILSEFGEYERTLVTVMNAYVGPGMRHYLSGFETLLKNIQVTSKVNIVRSDGGLMSLTRASQSPVHSVLSGPAGGVCGAALLASLSGYEDALGFDMGGTSTDVSLIRNGRATVSRQTDLGSYPVKIPSIEVHNVGAGGGSIAHVPMTGALRVGPESAGADPGPACYGRGGMAPTVTDANVVLGRLPPSLLGGEMTLDIKLAEEAVGRLARVLGLDIPQAAQGILDIVNENMFGALRSVTAEKGLDPGDFALVAFGGAGPLHGNAMAALAGCFPVIVPPAPGVLSALGFLYGAVRNEFTQTFVRRIEDVAGEEVAEIFSRLGGEASDWLQTEAIAAPNQALRYEADVRYVGHGREFSVQLNPETITAVGLHSLGQDFGEIHERIHGFTLTQPVEIVNLRVIGSGRAEKLRLAKFDQQGADPSDAVKSENQVYFDGQVVGTKIYDRGRLRSGNVVVGPAIVTQKDSTCVIHPGHQGRVDEYLNILITPSGN
jgi:N-methylhydantoinase A